MLGRERHVKVGVTKPKGSAALERGDYGRAVREGGLLFEQNRERQTVRLDA